MENYLLVPRKREDFKTQQEILESDTRKNSAMRNACRLNLGAVHIELHRQEKMGETRATFHL